MSSHRPKYYSMATRTHFSRMETDLMEARYASELDSSIAPTDRVKSQIEIVLPNTAE